MRSDAGSARAQTEVARHGSADFLRVSVKNQEASSRNDALSHVKNEGVEPNPKGAAETEYRRGPRNRWHVNECARALQRDVRTVTPPSLPTLPSKTSTHQPANVEYQHAASALEMAGRAISAASHATLDRAEAGS